MTTLIDVQNMCFRYGKSSVRGAPAPWILDDLSFTVARGAGIGIVGESGSGKSTLIRVLAGLLRHGAGTVRFDDRDIGDWLAHADRELRRRNQIVFQSPRRSLDPRMTIRRSLSQPMRSLEGRPPTAAELDEWLSRVSLGPEVLSRYPHQLSGGQLQRVGIARALSVRPDVLYADEPVSALDVSVQAQVLNLLMDVRAELGLTLVMVSHDLGVVSRLCDRVVVLRRGVIVEAGLTHEVLANPQDEYTTSLIAAARSVSLA